MDTVGQAYRSAVARREPSVEQGQINPQISCSDMEGFSLAPRSSFSFHPLCPFPHSLQLKLLGCLAHHDPSCKRSLHLLIIFSQLFNFSRRGGRKRSPRRSESERREDSLTLSGSIGMLRVPTCSWPRIWALFRILFELLCPRAGARI